MKEDYPFLFYCFSCFPAATGETERSHREYFITCAKNGYINIAATKADISFFEIRSESWLLMAKLSDAFFYSEDKNEDDILVKFQLLTWDIIYPERILSSDKLEYLKSKVSELLITKKEEDNSSSIHIDDIIWSISEEKEWETLSRFDLLYMQQKIGHPTINLEYYAPELWFFKLSHNS